MGVGDCIAVILLAVFIFACFVSGCMQAENLNITEDEALLIALNDTALTNATGGRDPGNFDTEISFTDDGEPVYTFRFQVMPPEGWGLIKDITIGVAGDGKVIRRKVTGGAMVTPSDPEMYAQNIPSDVDGKGALNMVLYPELSFRQDDLEVRLESVEFTNKSSEYYFVVISDFISETVTPQNKSNMPPGPVLNGNISVSGRDIEEFTKFYSTRWDGDAVGFTIRSDPVPVDSENVSVSICRIYGRDFDRNYEVI